MLAEFDRAREQAKGHKAQTFHGDVGEAECRKWLKNFLPKRYGVTSGYVVSPGLPSTEKVPHFDVIIYDRLESPILWAEDNPDSSGQGKSRALPVEYVYSVLEVKSAFKPSTVRDAINHLAELRPLMEGRDSPDDRYKVHLPPTFTCGLVFYELRQEQFYSKAALKAVVKGKSLRRFTGGIILRSEGSDKSETGSLQLVQSEEELGSTLENMDKPIHEFGMSESVKVEEDYHIASMLKWSESEFSQFAFDIIKLMKGEYELGRVSSFYGMGSEFHERAKEAKENQD